MVHIHDTKNGLHMNIYSFFPHGVEKRKLGLPREKKKIDWYHKFDNIFFPLPHQGLCNYSHVVKRTITTHVLKGYYNYHTFLNGAIEDLILNYKREKSTS